MLENWGFWDAVVYCGNIRASSEAQSHAQSHMKTCAKNPEKNLLPDDSSATSKRSSNSNSQLCVSIALCPLCLLSLCLANLCNCLPRVDHRHLTPACKHHGQMPIPMSSLILLLPRRQRLAMALISSLHFGILLLLLFVTPAKGWSSLPKCVRKNGKGCVIYSLINHILD